MRLRIVLLAVVACLAALAAGCGPVIVAGARLASEDTVKMPAEYAIGATPIVVVPFRDPARGYFESADGSDLATAVAGELIARKAASVVRPVEPVRAAFGGKDLDAVGWGEVARAANAQLVLTGEVLECRMRDPNTAGLLRGYMRVSVRVFDAKTNCIVYQSQGIEAWLPDYGIGVAESDVPSLERFRSALIATEAMKVVQKFYNWEKKIGPEPRRY